MTKEAKIAELRNIRDHFNYTLAPREVFDDAIKALEQEPKEITLEDVKGYCKPRSLTIITNEQYRELTHFKIKAREQELRWIPVDEKLPNDRSWYLGIFKEPDTGWINPLPFICDYVGRETKATTKEYWILHGFTDMDEHIDYYFNLECVKWMPLPPAYEIGEDE